MKISKGSTLEFVIALFLIYSGFTVKDNYIFMTTTLVVGSITIIHCLYIWIKQRKEKKSSIIIKKYNDDVNLKNNDKNLKIKPKKSYIILISISMILNILLIIGVTVLFVSNKNIMKERKYYKNILKNINFNTSTKVEQIWNPSKGEYEDNTEIENYLLAPNEFKKLKNCYDKFKIKIKINDGFLDESNDTKSEKCTFYPVEGNYKIMVAAESAAGVGDVFSKMDSDIKYRIRDNKYGDVFNVIQKYQGDSSIYKCDETWYLVQDSNNNRGFVWGGRQGMYVKENQF